MKNIKWIYLLSNQNLHITKTAYLFPQEISMDIWNSESIAIGQWTTNALQLNTVQLGCRR